MIEWLRRKLGIAKLQLEIDRCWGAGRISAEQIKVLQDTLKIYQDQVWYFKQAYSKCNQRINELELKLETSKPPYSYQGHATIASLGEVSVLPNDEVYICANPKLPKDLVIQPGEFKPLKEEVVLDDAPPCSNNETIKEAVDLIHTDGIDYVQAPIDSGVKGMDMFIDIRKIDDEK